MHHYIQVMQHSLFSEYKTTWRFKIEKKTKERKSFHFSFSITFSSILAFNADYL